MVNTDFLVALSSWFVCIFFHQPTTTPFYIHSEKHAPISRTRYTTLIRNMLSYKITTLYLTPVILLPMPTVLRWPPWSDLKKCQCPGSWNFLSLATVMSGYWQQQPWKSPSGSSSATWNLPLRPSWMLWSLPTDEMIRWRCSVAWPPPLYPAPGKVLHLCPHSLHIL